MADTNNVSKVIRLVTLRPCQRSDAGLLFAWRNNPIIVEQSVEKKTVTWDEHLKWLDRCLDSPETNLIFLIAVSHNPVGVIRFDREHQTSAEVSISLDPDVRGRGIGTTAIQQATQAMLEIWPTMRTVYAEILQANTRAQKSFEKCGFSQSSTSVDTNIFRYELSLDRLAP